MRRTAEYGGKDDVEVTTCGVVSHEDSDPDPPSMVSSSVNTRRARMGLTGRPSRFLYFLGIDTKVRFDSSEIFISIVGFNVLNRFDPFSLLVQTN